MTASITVLVVDDSDDLAGVLEAVIGIESDMMFAGRLASADDLLERVAADPPAVVLLDLTMPGRDPMDAMREASARFPQTRFLIMSGYDDKERIDEAMSAGAWGFITKHGDVDAVIAAVRVVASGTVYLSGGGL